MKVLSNLIAVTLLGAALGLSASAADQSNADQKVTQSGAMDMTEMQALMQAMQAQMAAIHAEKDPAKRAELMNQHMASMSAAMQTLQQNGGCLMSGSMMGGAGTMGNMMGMGVGRGAANDGSMGYMQQMLEQMQEHQKAMQGATK